MTKNKPYSAAKAIKKCVNAKHFKTVERTHRKYQIPTTTCWLTLYLKSLFFYLRSNNDMLAFSL